MEITHSRLKCPVSFNRRKFLDLVNGIYQNSTTVLRWRRQESSHSNLNAQQASFTANILRDAAVHMQPAEEQRSPCVCCDTAAWVGVQDTHPATLGTSRLGTNTSVFSIPYKQVPRLPEEIQEISQTRNT